MRTMRLHLLFPLLLLSPLVSPLTYAGDWKFVRESYDGIRIYQKAVQGSDVIAFKGEGIVDAPLSRVATVIFDTSHAKDWADDLTDSKIVRWTGPSAYIEYDAFATPFVMSNRDFVSTVTLTVDRVLRQFQFQYQPASDQEYPVQKSKVRGQLINSTFALTELNSGKATKLEGEIHCDPKGSIPKWIVNIFQGDWPVSTFRSLRKQVMKTEVKTDPRFEGVFEAKDLDFRKVEK